MAITGHPKVTERAYEQDRDVVSAAARTAEAIVHNALPRRHNLTPAEVLRLTAQIERDLLVWNLERTP